MFKFDNSATRSGSCSSGKPWRRALGSLEDLWPVGVLIVEERYDDDGN